MTTLLAPTQVAIGDVTWHDRAACRGLDTDRFFLADSVRGPSKVAQENAAKAVCHGCPVVANCLNWALAVAEPHGVWGGTTPQERNELVTQALLAG